MNNTKIYTAFDYRVAAESCEKLSKSFLCGDERDRAIYADRAAMLRQAADDAEELTKAKRPDACPGNPTNKMCYLPGEYCCDTVRYLQKENAKLRTLLASTVGYTCTLCGMKSSKMCGACAVFKAQEILEGGNNEQH